MILQNEFMLIAVAPGARASERLAEQCRNGLLGMQVPQCWGRMTYASGMTVARNYYETDANIWQRGATLVEKQKNSNNYIKNNL